MSKAQIEGVRLDPRWIKEIEVRCKRCNRKLESDYLKREGDAMYKVGRYGQALPWYLKFVSLNPGRHDIMARIEICKTKDPVYAQKQLDQAYKNAKQSPDFYMTTFKAYLRYGSTGNLSGEQYDFLTRMLLRHRGKIRRQFGYSHEEVDQLIRKYYLLTKQRGYSNSDLETLIPKHLKYER